MHRIEDHLHMFEAMQQFCYIVGDDWIEPQKETIFYYHLNHPGKKGEKLLAHMEYHNGFVIYIRAPEEGAPYKIFEDMPLVHVVLDPQKQDRPIFPYAVDVHRENTTYYYTRMSGGSTIILAEKIPKEVYQRMKELFDEANPHPWIERENPDHKLPMPEPKPKVDPHGCLEDS